VKITINQRFVLLVILATIFVLALLKGIMQTSDGGGLTAANSEVLINHPEVGRPDPQAASVDSGLTQPVLINSASVAEIAENLDGIGEAIARRIVRRREQQGPYQNFEQLKAVSGVGMAKIEANKLKISFEIPQSKD